MAGDFQTPNIDFFSRYTRRDLSVVEFQRREIKEYYLSFLPQGTGSASETIREVYERIGEFLSRLGAEIVNERCFAEISRYPEVCATRNGVYERHRLEHEGTLSFIGGTPVGDQPLAGVQVWAVVSGDSPAVRTMFALNRPAGRKFAHSGVSYVSIASVLPAPDLGLNGNLKNHAASMFRGASEVLAACGLTYRDVARTWIYLPQLLRWYDDFNAARRDVFTELGLYSGPHPLWLPASTGIQGHSAHGQECMMDLLAVSARPHGSVTLQMLHSPLQCEAYDYGSFFCRAVELKDESASRIYVSGTASIDDKGKTVFRDDPEGQIRFTLRVVNELVGTRGHSLKDIAHCVAFLKSPEYSRIFRRVADEEGLDPRVAVETVADVCRGDLLFELEAMTVKPVTAA